MSCFPENDPQYSPENSAYRGSNQLQDVINVDLSWQSLGTVSPLGACLPPRPCVYHQAGAIRRALLSIKL